MGRSFVAGLLFFLLASAAHAVIPPVDGFYWNSSQSGRGMAVETQDRVVFAAYYNYDSQNFPTFYIIQGDWDPVARRVSNARLLEVTSGPYIGGPFSPIGPIADRGPVTLEFPTFTTARFSFNGQTTSLERFLFAYGPQANSLLRGSWTSTIGALGVYFGDFIDVTGVCTVPSCGSFVEPFVGKRFNGGASRILVGQRLPNGQITFLLDSSASYYELYIFELRVNQWVGTSNIYLKTSNPTGAGLLTIGNRINGPTFIIPSSEATNDSKRVDDGDEQARLKAALQARAGAAPPEAKAIDTSAAKAALPAMRAALEELSNQR